MGCVFQVVGKVVQHARRTLLRLSHAVFQTLLNHWRAKILSFPLALPGD